MAREAGAHYPGIFALDPAKILISTQGTGLTGVALRDLLRREYRIEVEMALDHYVLAMTRLGHRRRHAGPPGPGPAGH